MLRVTVIFVLFTWACSTSTEDTNTEQWERDTVTTEQSIQQQEQTNVPLPGDRVSWQNPNLVLEKLGNIDGKTVADIGAGTGFFTFRLAEKGASVIAIDIDPDFLRYINDRTKQSELNQEQYIQTRLSMPDDPLLEPNEAEVVLLVNTYSFIGDRTAYLMKVRSGMKSNGIICIVDYKNNDVPVIGDDTPVLPSEIVRAELENAEFKQIAIDTSSLEFQYIITAKI